MTSLSTAMIPNSKVAGPINLAMQFCQATFILFLTPARWPSEVLDEIKKMVYSFFQRQTNAWT